MCGGGDGGAAESRQMEIDRQNRIKEGISAVNNAFRGFDDSFYAKQKNTYAQWARPQVARQYNQALDQLRYGMARTGLGASSAGARAKADLTYELGVQNQNVEQQAREYEQRSRQNVEMARGDLIGQAVSTTDPTAAANSALSRATATAAGPAYTPVGALFQAASPIVVNNMKLQQFNPNLGMNMGWNNNQNKGDSGKVVS